MSDIVHIGPSRDMHPAARSPDAMTIVLTVAQATELRSLLDEALGDLSSEIADTDNAEFRSALRLRRDLIRQIREGL